MGLASIALLDVVSGGDLTGGKGAILLPTVAALMLVAGLVAAIGPARRGLHTQPTQALRED